MKSLLIKCKLQLQETTTIICLMTYMCKKRKRMKNAQRCLILPTIWMITRRSSFQANRQHSSKL